jgi:hypothetical protein
MYVVHPRCIFHTQTLELQLNLRGGSGRLYNNCRMCVVQEGRWVIFNDEKVAASEHPPLSLGYMYVYERVQG